MGSWHDDDALRRDVLAQMQAHLGALVAGAVVVRGESLALYGWRTSTDVAQLVRVLGLPADVLHLGLELFEPDGEYGATATTTTITNRLTLLRAIAPGRDLTGIAATFVAACAAREDAVALGADDAAARFAAALPRPAPAVEAADFEAGLRTQLVDLLRASPRARR